MAIPCSLRTTVTRSGKTQKRTLQRQAFVTVRSQQGQSQIGEDLAGRLQLSGNVSIDQFWFGVKLS